MIGIKNFEMPKCCLVCDYALVDIETQYSEYDKPYCMFSGKCVYDYVNNKRHPDCPLADLVLVEESEA